VSHSEYFNIDFGVNVIQGSVLSPTCSILKWYLQLRVDYLFSARHHICYSALYAIARPSVRLSVCLSDTRVDQSKTVDRWS